MPRIAIILAALALAGIAVLTAVLLLSVSVDPEDSRGVIETPAADATAESSAPVETLAATQPDQVRLLVDVSYPLGLRIHSEAQALAAEMGVLLIANGAAASGGVIVSLHRSEAEAPSAVVERWVAVASLWSQREDVALGQQIDFPLLLPAERRVELEHFLGDPAFGATVRWLPQGDIPAALAGDVNAVALLPLGVTLETPGLRTLALGADGEPWLEQRMSFTAPDEGHQEFARRLAERIDVPAPALTTIAFTGDIIPARCVYERQRNLDDYTAAFEYVKAYLSSADITAGSLDAALSDVGEPYPCKETFNLMAPSRSVEGLVAAGFDVITVATNHARDCGIPDFGCGYQSLLDTLANLRGAGIASVGGGETLAEARSPAIIERNGVHFAFLGYDDVAAYLAATDTLPGTAPLSEEALRADIAAARERADVVIVLAQWGAEYISAPTDRQLALGRIAIEAGATLVIGNHPHVVQGTEAAPGSFIAYALGNFVFDQDWSLETQQGAILEATFAGDRLLGVNLKPVRIVSMFQPTFAEPAEAASILERMRASTEALLVR